MSITSISSASSVFSASADPSRQAFGQLASAIQSGNLAAAQTAYSALTQNGSPDPNSPLAAAINQIGQALQSGNVSQAQQDLTALQQQAHAAKGAHHHHGGHHASADSQTTTTATAETDPTPSATSISPAPSSLLDVTA
jgi:hypothetical protein